MALHADLDTRVSLTDANGGPQMPVTSADFQRFPQYKPRANKFSIWSESYGGHYGPTFSDYFESQNKLIADGTITESAVPLRLDTVGIVNGCIDILTQIPTYPELAFNNTYGIQAINESVYQAAVDSFPACRENVETCRSLSDEYDPQLVGNNATVNKICKGAFDLCFSTMWSGYSASGVSSPWRPYLR